MKKMKRLALVVMMALLAVFCLFGATACDNILDRGDRDSVVECTHDWEQLVLEAETWKCGEKATVTLRCKKCDLTKTEEFEKLPHAWKYTAEIPATCENDGKTAYARCQRCKAYENDKKPETIQALGHDGENGAPTLADSLVATCQTPGYCGRCQQTYKLKLADHTPDIRHEEAVAATCTEDGHNAYDYCTGCSYTTKIVFKALGHDWENHAKKDATCTADGHSAYKSCKRCGEEENKTTLDALGHDTAFENKNSKAANCQERAYCGRCEDYYGDVLTDHIPQIVQYVAKAATCTLDGYDAYEMCERCSYTTKIVFKKLGHDTKMECEGSKEANCTDSAYCGRCQQHYGEALGHDGYRENDNGSFHNANSKKATCEDQAHCGICGRDYGLPLGHLNIEVPKKDATCEEDGCNAYVVCKREGCGYTTYDEETTPIKKLGHDWYTYEFVAPTCTTEGSTEGVVCLNANCGCVLKEKVTLPALGHDKGQRTHTVITDSEGKQIYVAVTENMKNEKGLLYEGSTLYDCVTDGHCGDCGVTYRKHTLAGHDYGKQNCTTERTCILCKHKEAAGTHTESVWTGEAPTCTTVGWTDGKKCSVCGAVIEARTEIPTIAHNSDGLIKPIEATETTAGKTQGCYCTMCKEQVTVEPKDVAAHTHDFDENGNCRVENCEKHHDGHMHIYDADGNCTEEGCTHTHTHIYKEGECVCGKHEPVGEPTTPDDEDDE